LSVGSLMAVSGAVAMEFLSSAGSSPGAALGALGLALLLGAALGTVNAVLVSVVGLQPFISTLVLMLAGRGLAKVITGGQNTAASNGTFRWIANGYVLGIPVVFVLAVLIVILVGLLVRRSALGLMIEAIGMDPQAARLAGVNRQGLLSGWYIPWGVLEAVGGVSAPARGLPVHASTPATSWRWTRSSPWSSAAPPSPAASSTSPARRSAPCSSPRSTRPSCSW